MKRKIVACLLAAAMITTSVIEPNAAVFAAEAADNEQVQVESSVRAAKPAAPQNVHSTKVEKNSISLAWDAVSGAESYTIYRAQDDPDTYKVWLNWEKKVQSTDPFKKIADGVTATEFVDSDRVTTNVPYYYKIVAVNADGEGEASAVCKVDGKTAIEQKSREKYTDRALVGMDLAGKDGAETLVTATDADGREYTKGVYLSWRSFEDDFSAGNTLSTTFTVYKNGAVLAENLKVTNLVDPEGSSADKYKVVGSNDAAIGISNQPEIKPWDDKYLELSLYAPEDEKMPKGKCTYSANDLSVGDADGDGDLELIVKWYPSNAQDNSNGGYTGETFLDTYDVDWATGDVKLLTRINMGINIRSGAHYTQFQVWDFDGDGKAELAAKTCHGTTTYKTETGKPEDLVMVDHVGAVDNTQLPPSERKTAEEYDYRNDSGHIIVGDEFFSIFNLDDGTKAAPDVNYEPERGPADKMPVNWGNGDKDDSYGNRSERYLSGTAYLDGEHPYAVFTRGYYERIAMTAYYLKDTDNDGIGDIIDKYWLYDTGTDRNSEENILHRSEGNHGLSINDVDGDGKDEIIFGSLIVDHDGVVRNGTGLGHGDAMHVSDWVPSNPGLEVMDVHEHDNVSLHVEVHDANTGEILMGYYTGKDTGRGAMADIDPTSEGAEWWSIASPTYESNDEPEWDSNGGEVYASSSTMETLVKLADTNPPPNFTIFWDGDLLSELQDHKFNKKSYTPRGVNILKWNYETGETEPLLYSEEIWSNNGTKGNVGLAADILGDWREEIITRTSDAADADGNVVNNTVRIYSTTIQTDYVVPCLLENLAYREGVAWQNVGYNQPANLDYMLSEGLVTAQVLEGDTTVNTADILYTEASDGKYGHEISGYEVWRAEQAADGTLGEYTKAGTIPVSDMKVYEGELPTISPDEAPSKQLVGYDEEVLYKFDIGTKSEEKDKQPAIEGVIMPKNAYSKETGYGFVPDTSGITFDGVGTAAMSNTENQAADLVQICGDLAYKTTGDLNFAIDIKEEGTYRVDVYASNGKSNSAYNSNKIIVNDEDLGAVSSSSDMTTFLKTTMLTFEGADQILVTAKNPGQRAFMNAIVVTKVTPKYIYLDDNTSSGTTNPPSDNDDAEKQTWYVYTDQNLKENTTYSYKIAAIVDNKTSHFSRQTSVRTLVSGISIPEWEPIEIVQDTPLGDANTIKNLLPTEMPVKNSQGQEQMAPVIWSGYGKVDIETVGDYTINAAVRGYDQLVPATVKITKNGPKELVEPIKARVVVGENVLEYLPEKVTIRYLNGTTKLLKVTWSETDLAKIDTSQKTGETPHEVTGTCAGGFEIKAAVTVEDDYIIDLENLYPEIPVGTEADKVEAALPKKATATYRLGSTKDVDITWSDIAVDTSVSGYYTGTAAYTTDGYDEPETASISVTYPVVKQFNFGIDGSKTPDGWIAILSDKDGAKTVKEHGIEYTDEKGYGFEDENAKFGGRNQNYVMEGLLPQDVYNSLIMPTGQTFKVKLPNGRYEVTLVSGSTDKNTASGEFQDESTVSASSAASAYAMGTTVVNVTNGMLAFTWDGGTQRTDAMIIREIELAPVVTVDKSKLTEAIEKAKGYSEEEYTAASYAVLKEALDTAEALAEDQQATQDQVDGAVTALNAAMEQMQKKDNLSADKSALVAAIDKANGYDKTKYTAESYTVLEQAVATAKLLNENPNATKEQIAEAVAAIENAITGLKENGGALQPPAAADKTVLSAAITAAAAYATADYTPESYKVFMDALTAAANVNADAAATQEQVNNALGTLNAAISALVKAEPGNTEKPSTIPAKGKPVQAVGDKDSSYKVSGTGKTPTVEFTGTKAKKVVIPDTIKDANGNVYKVTSIAAKAFTSSNKKNVTSVTIGNNITKIANKQFAGFTKLATVKIGKGVKTIGNDAFSGDKKLSKLTIGSKVTTIGNNAFKKCTSLKNVKIPNSTTKIGASAFAGCTKLQSVTIGTGLKTIGKSAFSGDTKLSKITIKSKKLSKVDSNAFKNINKKAKFTVPKGKASTYKRKYLNSKAGVKKTMTVK